MQSQKHPRVLPILLTDIELMKTRFPLSSRRRVGAGVEEAAAGHVALVKCPRQVTAAGAAGVSNYLSMPLDYEIR